MRRLFMFIRPYWRAALLAPLMMLVEVAADLIQPRLMVNIIDVGVANRDLAYVYAIGARMIAIGLVGLIGGMGATIFSCTASQGYGKDLRAELFAKVQSYSFAELDKFKTASLITRLTNDVAQVQQIVLFSLRMLVRAPLLAFGGAFMALLINPGLSSVLLVSLPLLGIALAVIMGRSFPMFGRVQMKLDKLNSVMRENLAGVRVVKAFVRSDYEKARFKRSNEELTGIALKANRLVGLTTPAMLMTMNISMIAVLWFGGWKVQIGTMTVGQVMAFVNYITQILMALQMVAHLMVMISRAKASADRIIEVMEVDSAISSPEAAIGRIDGGRVDFERVSFHYKGAAGDPVLKDISLTVMPGSTLGILGATGSGKSTLVNLIPRFYDPTAGRVLIDGTDIRMMDLDSLRSSIGMVLQDSVLFTGTVRENLLWGRADASDEQMIEAASAAQAHGFIMSFPEGYDTMVGQKGVNLSGGQKQRIAIARALLRRPRILIMDDSTSAVDLGTEERLQSAIRAKMGGMTTVVIAQRISSVMDADRIIVLEDGSVAADGSHRQLMESSKLYRDIVSSQLGEDAA